LTLFIVEILVTLNNYAFLFSLTTSTWREGPTIPGNVFDANYVPLDNGFMVIGGLEDVDLGFPMNTAFTIDNDYNWKEFSDAFATPKYLTMGVNVPNDFLSC